MRIELITLAYKMFVLMVNAEFEFAIKKVFICLRFLFSNKFDNFGFWTIFNLKELNYYGKVL